MDLLQILDFPFLPRPSGEVSATPTDEVYNEYENPRTAQSFMVDKQDIVNNDYDLSINKYKETEYIPVEYPSTAEIMADLHELEMEITKGLVELEEMLWWRK